MNGQDYDLLAEPHEMLRDVLREKLGFVGVKLGCDYGGCGACTVILDGRLVYSCMVWVGRANGKRVLTVEGLARGNELHPLQKAFLEHGAFQCGYCIPGMLMAAKDLLDRNPEPTEADVREAIVGSICRCTGYVKIVEAILAAAKGERRVE